MSLARWLQGELEGKTRAQARAVALGQQLAAQFARGQGAAVQAKAVAVLTGGESVVEDAGEVLRWNTHAIVNDGDADVLAAISGAHGQALVVARRFFASVFGVADQ